MKTEKLFGILALLFCTFFMNSCGDDDEPNPFPEGTSFLRMMNEDNGQTALGNSDVYITNAGNFRSDQFPIFDMGKKQGISDIDVPDFTNMAPEVAAQPGHGYVICAPQDVYTFNSRKKAIREDADMYRVFVDSWIKNEDGQQTGANVYFLLGKPIQDKNAPMPEYESNIGLLAWNDVENKSQEISLSFSSDDIEVVFDDENSTKVISYSIDNHTLVFRRINPVYPDNSNHRVFIRHKNVYTRVYITVA